MIDTFRLHSAYRFAFEAHGDQVYGDVAPYIFHCVDVVKVLQRYGADEDLVIAGLLHDTLEDTDTTYAMIECDFGKRVADLVYAVTNEPGANRAERHAKTYPKIVACQGATMLKLADRIANVEYSVAHNSPQLGMYKKEYPGFKAALYQPNWYVAMWDRLDALLEGE